MKPRDGVRQCEQLAKNITFLADMLLAMVGVWLWIERREATVEGGSDHWAQRTSTRPGRVRHVIGRRRFVLGYLDVMKDISRCELPFA